LNVTQINRTFDIGVRIIPQKPAVFVRGQ
jgi:hypothetical protein